MDPREIIIKYWPRISTDMIYELAQEQASRGLEFSFEEDDITKLLSQNTDRTEDTTIEDTTIESAEPADAVLDTAINQGNVTMPDTISPATPPKPVLTPKTCADSRKIFSEIRSARTPDQLYDAIKDHDLGAITPSTLIYVIEKTTGYTIEKETGKARQVKRRPDDEVAGSEQLPQITALERIASLTKDCSVRRAILTIANQISIDNLGYPPDIEENQQIIQPIIESLQNLKKLALQQKSGQRDPEDIMLGAVIDTRCARVMYVHASSPGIKNTEELSERGRRMAFSAIEGYTTLERIRRAGVIAIKRNADSQYIHGRFDIVIGSSPVSMYLSALNTYDRLCQIVAQKIENESKQRQKKDIKLLRTDQTHCHCMKAEIVRALFEKYNQRDLAGLYRELKSVPPAPYHPTWKR